jgi:hypothetical protein
MDRLTLGSGVEDTSTRTEERDLAPAILATAQNSTGEQQCGGDNDVHPYGAWCRAIAPGATLHFTLDTQLEWANETAVLRLVYLAPAALTLYYDDGEGGKAGISTKNFTEDVMDGTKESWQDVQVNVHGLKARGGGPRSSDVWLVNEATTPARVHMIEVRKP